MSLPENWAWLEKETAPKILTEAIKLYGIKEKVGSGSNPVILGWAKELGLKDYTDDSIPWCGLFMAYVAFKAGYAPVKDPLWAKNWANFGVKKKNTEAELGDILSFSRDGGGHVAVYVAETKNYFFILGGNQGDASSIIKIDKGRLYSVNSPKWINKPANVRKVFVKDDGAPVSKNEA